MRLILAPKLAKVFFTARVSMTHRSVKLPGLKEAAHPRHPFSASLFWMEKVDWMFWKASKGWMAEGAGSCVMFGLAPSGLSFSVSFSVKLSVAGRGGAGKGGSCVLIPDLVVMAKVGALGFRLWALGFGFRFC
ncbi:hypothetical protein Tco_0452200 [Tanacetum coccineum]